MCLSSSCRKSWTSYFSPTLISSSVPVVKMLCLFEEPLYTKLILNLFTTSPNIFFHHYQCFYFKFLTTEWHILFGMPQLLCHMFVFFMWFNNATHFSRWHHTANESSCFAVLLFVHSIFCSVFVANSFRFNFHLFYVTEGNRIF